MGRIAISKNIERYFSDPDYRAAVTDCLDYTEAPRALSREALRSWLNTAVEANHLRNDFGKFMQKLYKEVWLTGIKEHIRPTLSRTVCSYLDSYTESAVSIKLIEDIWEARMHSGQIGLPIVSPRKSTFPTLRTSIVVDMAGYIVLGFEIIRPFRIKRLHPHGWRYSETSGHEFLSGIKLSQTRNLDTDPLKQAASDALKTVAGAYVPTHLRRQAA